MVFFGDDGEVEDIHDGGLPSYLSVTDMRAIEKFAKAYIKKHKTDEQITLLNNNLNYQRYLDEMAGSEKRRQERKNNPKPPPVDQDCFIYLIKDGRRGLHKVGKANNVSTRFSQLKTANPGIELVFHYRGKESDEKAIHSVLEGFGKRVDGEWFNMNEADIQYFQQYFVKEDLPF